MEFVGYWVQWRTCGTLTVVTTQSAGGNAIATTASYTAPLAAPAPNAISVTVTPLADPSKSVQRVFAIQGIVGGGVNCKHFSRERPRAR